MARVFISYRRADGQYAVGWIEEVLRRLETVADVRTAFRDSDLRHGDDFPQQLADEVEACDVLIAVIGPHWRGDGPNGSARILDPADWVGREIDSALRLRKRIIPVLLDGVEPLQAGDLLPEHREFADLHALRFNEAAALGVLLEDVKSHLEEIDAERARIRGLEEPIETPSFMESLTLRTATAASAAGLLGLGVGFAIAAMPPPPPSNLNWRIWSLVQMGMWTALAVVGVVHVRRVLLPAVDVRWHTVRRSAGLAAVLIGLTVIAFGRGDGNQVARTLVQAPLAVALMSPWILMLLAAHWTSPRETTEGARALVIAIERRSLREAVPVAALALVPAIFTTAALANAGELEAGDIVTLLGLGIFLTLILAAAANYSTTKLIHDSELVARSVEDLARPYRRNAEAVLVTDQRDLWGWAVWWALLPTLAAVGAAVVGAVK